MVKPKTSFSKKRRPQQAAISKLLESNIDEEDITVTEVDAKDSLKTVELSSTAGSEINTKAEIKQSMTLPQLEKQVWNGIEKGKECFLSIGEALAEIQETGLYKKSVSRTFEEYCKEKFDIKSSNVYRYIDAFKAHREIFSPIGEKTDLPLLKSESHYRELVKVKGTPADVKSWKLRINQSKFSVLMWQSVGANPVPLPFSEFHAAIQTGMVNGGDLTPTFYVFMGFPKLAPYLTLTEHSRQPGFILMSLKAWNRFSSAQQKQFMDSQEPISGLRKQIRGLDTMMAAKYEKAGGPVHHLTPEERQQWEDAVIPQQQKIVEMVGGQSERVWAMIQDGKASCKK